MGIQPNTIQVSDAPRNRTPRKHFSGTDAQVALRLKAARLEAGISQEKAAEHLNLTFQQLQKYEKGSNRISCGKLAILAEVYGKPIAWFFEGVAAGPGNAEGDLGAEFLGTHGARELARAFIAIKDNAARRVVIDVANTIARIR